jgi:hypothetical protein
MEFIKSQFRNAKKLNPSWSNENKIFALALYKRGPRSYRFLRHFLKLPSRTTLHNFFKHIPFDSGINLQLFEKLKIRVQKMDSKNKICKLIFDEVALSTNLTYSRSTDKIIGYEDLGSLGRNKNLANHALVFMVQGLCSGWKQPISYYFVKDTVKSQNLKFLITEVITELQKIGLKIVCTVCDQAATNVEAINLLKTESNVEPLRPYFFINLQQVICFYDVPHLLKSTRNALLKYTIYYEEIKKAKFLYLRKAYEHDKNRRFQTLRKIRECYLYVNKYRHLKMKVSVAAKTFSASMAAALETMVDCNQMSCEALETAYFVQDLNDLFDSFNSTGIKINKCNPRLRCALTSNSCHWNFWENMKLKIKTWQFFNEKSGQIKEDMPFKHGWLNNIEAIKMLWNVCNKADFKFLRTRMLNQDPVENLFAVIRQYGAGHNNPNCFQFISTLKTTILNNLISNKSYSENCEKDEGKIWDNLRNFLSQKEILTPSVNESVNELLTLQVPTFDKNNAFSDGYDLQALTYVIKKLKKSFNCDSCKTTLTTENLNQSHIFTLYKEYDKKLRLNYATENVCLCVAEIFDAVVFYLDKCGEINNIIHKMEATIVNKVNFNWITCNMHKNEIKKDILYLTIKLVVFKTTYSKKI